MYRSYLLCNNENISFLPILLGKCIISEWNILFCIAKVIFSNETLCAIWYHLYELKNGKNTHGGVLLLVKLQVEPSNFTKSNISPRMFFTFFKFCKWYQIVKSVTNMSAWTSGNICSIHIKACLAVCLYTRVIIYRNSTWCSASQRFSETSFFNTFLLVLTEG